jgi:Na+/H+-dicarboxylate symporter
MMFGVLLGGFLGVEAPNLMLAIAFIGDLFIGALTFAILPLMLTGVVLGVYQMGNQQKLVRVVRRAILFFLGFGVLASLIGLVVAIVFNPGVGSITLFSDIHKNWSPLSTVHIPGWIYIGLVLFSILFGVALASFGSRVRSVTNFLGQANQALMSVFGGLIYAAPIGLFSITGSLMARDEQVGQSALAIFSGGQTAGAVLLESAGAYLLAVVVGLLVMGLIVVPAILKLFGKQPVLKLLRSVSPAIMTSFGVSSSLSAMPFTYFGLTEKQGMDSRAGALTLPLGLVFNVGATALCTVVATLFIAQAAGISLSVFQYVLILVLPLLLSMGKVGLPYPLLAILTGQLAMIGMPAGAIAGLGVVLVVDWLVDRFRSALNVWSDSAGAAVVAEAFEFKTARVTRSSPRERSSGRTTRPSGRGRPPRQTSSTSREGISGGQRGRDQQSSDRRGSAKPAVRTSVTSSPPSRPRLADRTAKKFTEASPFDMSDSQAPKLDIDVTGPAASPPAREKAASGESGDSRRAPARTPRPHQPAVRSERPKRSANVPRPKKTETIPETAQSSAKESGRPDPETIARELKKVSAQLVLYDEEATSREKAPANQPKPEPVTEKSRTEDSLLPVSSTPSPEADRQEHVSGTSTSDSAEDTPATNQSDDSVVETSLPEPAKQKPEPADETTQTDTEKSEAPHFGRTMTRRGKSRPSGQASDEPAEVQEDLSAKTVTTFGRGKRKRTRR